MFFKYFFIFLFMIQIVKAAQFELKSNPDDSEIYVINDETGKRKLIGKTPYTADFNTIKAEAGKDKSIQLSVVKPGFEDFNIVLPPLASTDMRIAANLKVEKDIALTSDFDMLVSDLFDVLRMTRLKDYETANSKLDILINKFPHFSVVYEMKGLNYYLSKEFKKSLNFYKKAFSVNPKNREAYKMMIYLEKKFNLGDKNE